LGTPEIIDFKDDVVFPLELPFSVGKVWLH